MIEDLNFESNMRQFPCAFITTPLTGLRRHKQAHNPARTTLRRLQACSRPILRACQSESESKDKDKKVLGFVGADMIGLAFTCDANDCGTRISKRIKRRSYERGTVVVQCPTCEKYHIIADNMGMYKEVTGGARNVEELAKQQGQKVKRVDSASFDFKDDGKFLSSVQ